MTDPRVHDTDLRVHDDRSRCSRWRDLRVHDGVIRAFTMDRNPHRFASDVHCGYREGRPKRFAQEYRKAGPGTRGVNPGSLHNSFGRRAAVKNIRSEILINAGGLDSRKVRLALSNRVVWPFQPLMPIVYARIFQKRAILIQSARLECWPI